MCVDEIALLVSSLGDLHRLLQRIREGRWKENEEETKKFLEMCNLGIGCDASIQERFAMQKSEILSAQCIAPSLFSVCSSNLSHTSRGDQ